MSRPLIGVTTVNEGFPLGPFAKPVTLVNETFLTAISDVGGCPLPIPNLCSAEDLDHLASLLDGLLLTGGADIDPSNYGQAQLVTYDETVRPPGSRFRRPAGARPDPRRDKLELELYRRMRKRRRPIFGICRGMQLINVAEGGTLHQELPETASLQHDFGRDGWIPNHDLLIVPGTLAHRIMGIERTFISSLHHQALDRLGEGLIASGHAPDDVVELIEGADRDCFLMGVIGHIEQQRQNQASFNVLFEGFVERAARSKD